MEGAEALLPEDALRSLTRNMCVGGGMKGARIALPSRKSGASARGLSLAAAGERVTFNSAKGFSQNPALFRPRPFGALPGAALRTLAPGWAF